MLIDKQTKYELIIPDFLFEESKIFILVEIPFWISNKNTVKRFLDKLQSFVHHKFDIAVKWSPKKIRSFLRLKDKNPHPAWKIYQGTCSSSENYTGKTNRNFETRWNEHENQNKDSEPVKHLRDFLGHKFDWKRLHTLPTSAKFHKILESSVIALKSYNFDQLILFINCVT